MAKTSQINIRFDPETDAQLTELAESLGVSKSSLVRRLTEKFIEEVRKMGTVEIDPEWLRNLAKADARSEWGERKTQPLAKVADDVVQYKVSKPKRRESP